MFVLSLGTTVAAQNAEKSATTVKKRGCFVDENKDSVCDKCQKNACVRAQNYKSGKTENACDGSGYPLKSSTAKKAPATKGTKK